MAKKTKLPGLYWDKATGKGTIDKRIPGGGRIHHRFTAGSASEAEEHYHRAITDASQKAKSQKDASRTFRAAATHYLKTETKKSLSRDADSLEILDRWIGDLILEQLHQGTLQPFIEQRKLQGVKSSTVARDLAIVRRILTLASRVWRDENNRPWLPIAPPIIRLPDWQDDAKPYPLSWDEQRRLLQHLPAHLQCMALFALNTGAREQVICSLRWEWETPLPELGSNIFLVPGRPTEKWEGTKSKKDQVIVLNRTARSIIDVCRGLHDEWVFVRNGERIQRINNTAWRHAWRKAGLPANSQTLAGPHNLRHTFARRLRMAGVPLETRKALLHHTDGDITLHYSPAEIRELLMAVEKITEVETGTILKIVNR